MGEAVRRAGESLRFSEGNWALGWFAFDVELPMLDVEGVGDGARGGGGRRRGMRRRDEEEGKEESE